MWFLNIGYEGISLQREVSGHLKTLGRAVQREDGV